MPTSLSNKELHTLINIIDDCFKSELMPKEVEVLYKRMVRATKKITVQSAKSKGRGLQYWVCEKIGVILGVKFVQSDDLCPVHSREMGQSGSDIVLRTIEAQKKFPFTVECKSAETFELIKTIEQVRANQKDGTSWMIVHKRKALMEPIVILEWTSFENLLRGLK
ncbi:MAG: hypothetical protein C4K49_10735 [Candidatus Thorarchaeota archaeon]|nr:MAG: hypothetical protein C4K49_10735 [Candidatus Thorarchaeota archaeon]